MKSIRHTVSAMSHSPPKMNCLDPLDMISLLHTVHYVSFWRRLNMCTAQIECDLHYNTVEGTQTNMLYNLILLRVTTAERGEG